MFGPGRCQLSTAACPGDETNLQKIRLDDVFQRSNVFIHRGRDRLNAYGAACIGAGGVSKSSGPVIDPRGRMRRLA